MAFQGQNGTVQPREDATAPASAAAATGAIDRWLVSSNTVPSRLRSMAGNRVMQEAEAEFDELKEMSVLRLLREFQIAQVHQPCRRR